LIERIEDLKLARRRVLVLCGKPLSGKTAVAKEVCHQSDAAYIDVSSDLLPKITSPLLGAYGPDDLLDWIKRQAIEGDFICVDEIEPVLATFGEQGARSFFRMLSSIEPKRPTVVVTRLAKLLEDSRFPDKRIFRI